MTASFLPVSTVFFAFRVGEMTRSPLRFQISTFFSDIFTCEVPIIGQIFSKLSSKAFFCKNTIYFLNSCWKKVILPPQVNSQNDFQMTWSNLFFTDDFLKIKRISREPCTVDVGRNKRGNDRNKHGYQRLFSLSPRTFFGLNEGGIHLYGERII